FSRRDDDHRRTTVRTFLEVRAWPCRLCLLLLDRGHRIRRHAPRVLSYAFLCDGPTIDKAEAHKTEQAHEVGEQRPLEPNCFRCGITHGDISSGYSITSSARSRIGSGTARPSALAVLRLTAISNFVGNCTGRSPGFSPRRMRSTYEAARREMSPGS